MLKRLYMSCLGEPSSLCGYVKSGYLCLEFIKHDGETKIGGFAFKDALIGDFPFCLNNEPSHFDIVARRKSKVWLMDGQILKGICDNDPYAKQTMGIADGIFLSISVESFLQYFTKITKQKGMPTSSANILKSNRTFHRKTLPLTCKYLRNIFAV